MQPGEIVLEDASRAFDIRGDRGRTVKELLLGKARAGGPPPVQALRDVTLRIEPGETVGIVGRNGAGKSSTLRALAGIVPLDSGRADCGGRVVTLLEPDAVGRLDRQPLDRLVVALRGRARAGLLQRLLGLHAVTVPIISW